MSVIDLGGGGEWAYAAIQAYLDAKKRKEEQRMMEEQARRESERQQRGEQLRQGVLSTMAPHRAQRDSTVDANAGANPALPSVSPLQTMENSPFAPDRRAVSEYLSYMVHQAAMSGKPMSDKEMEALVAGFYGGDVPLGSAKFSELSFERDTTYGDPLNIAKAEEARANAAKLRAEERKALKELQTAGKNKDVESAIASAEYLIAQWKHEDSAVATLDAAIADLGGDIYAKRTNPKYGPMMRQREAAVARRARMHSQISVEMSKFEHVPELAALARVYKTQLEESTPPPPANPAIGDAAAARLAGGLGAGTNVTPSDKGKLRIEKTQLQQKLDNGTATEADVKRYREIYELLGGD